MRHASSWDMRVSLMAIRSTWRAPESGFTVSMRPNPHRSASSIPGRIAVASVPRWPLAISCEGIRFAVTRWAWTDTEGHLPAAVLLRITSTSKAGWCVRVLPSPFAGTLQNISSTKFSLGLQIAAFGRARFSGPGIIAPRQGRKILADQTRLTGDPSITAITPFASKCLSRGRNLSHGGGTEGHSRCSNRFDIRYDLAHDQRLSSRTSSIGTILQ